MRRAKRPALAPLPTTSKGNNVVTSSKHSLQSSQDPPSDTEDDNYFVAEEPQHLNVYLLEQLFVVKGLLEEAEAKEKTFFYQRQECKRKNMSLNVKYSR